MFARVESPYAILNETAISMATEAKVMGKAIYDVRWEGFHT
jgi:hypothetical protein